MTDAARILVVDDTPVNLKLLGDLLSDRAGAVRAARQDLGAVVAVLILDAQGNKNRFEFYDAQEPSSIDASEFQFTPPAGTNITKN